MNQYPRPQKWQVDLKESIQDTLKGKSDGGPTWALRHQGVQRPQRQENNRTSKTTERRRKIEQGKLDAFLLRPRGVVRVQKSGSRRRSVWTLGISFLWCSRLNCFSLVSWRLRVAVAPTSYSGRNCVVQLFTCHLNTQTRNPD